MRAPIPAHAAAEMVRRLAVHTGPASAGAFAAIALMAGFAGAILAEAPALTNAISNAQGAGIANTAELPEAEKFKIRKPTYEYRSGEARDPFFPLTKVVFRDEDATKQKTQFEMYDISQMKLMAIVRDAKGGYALIGLPDGKFYTLRTGMPMGLRSGITKKIAPDHVMVEEHVRDPKGKLKPQEVFIRLREEASK